MNHHLLFKGSINRQTVFTQLGYLENIFSKIKMAARCWWFMLVILVGGLRLGGSQLEDILGKYFTRLPSSNSPEPNGWEAWLM
jgi:hypothetical protein